jgi:5-methylcytosine-specific restriction protein B
MMPRIDLLPIDCNGINLQILLSTINNRIEKLLDKDHQIGHSYFISVNSTGDLKNAFYNKIIPLLQEYFFGDYGKIGLVLSNGFVKRKEWNKKTNSFASFDYESANSFDDRDVFEIVDYRKNEVQEIKYKNEKRDIKFEEAIKLIISDTLE